MNSLFGFLDIEASRVLVEQIGWLLVHSLWQFALIALGACGLARILRRSSASSRYLVQTAALILMVLAPVCTWFLLPNAGSPGSVSEVRSVAQLQVPLEIEQETAETTGSQPVDQTRINFQDVSDEVTSSKTTATRWWSRPVDFLQPHLSLIVTVWFCGVLVCAVRPLIGWYTVCRLRRAGLSAVGDSVSQAMLRIKRQLGIRGSVRVFQSTRVSTPIVVGCFRSVILLPVSLLTGLPASQLEAILTHELAHVRRYDYLVNLAQTLVETLFFYHPAVWWLSHRIRIERENCCDDLVVATLGDRIQYGRALLAIEEQCGSEPGLALGARGGSLLTRVQRIMLEEAEHQRSPGGTLASLAAVTCSCIALVVLATLGGTSTAEDAVPAPGPESHGLQFRLVALSPAVDDESPDLHKALKNYTRSSDMTFGIELKNVSDKPLTLAGVRYGEGYAETTRGKLNKRLAPHLFDFVFLDREGNPVPRVQREFYDAWHVADSGSVHELEPGESLIEVLRPAEFYTPMDYDLAPGEYSVSVRYRGHDDTFREKVREHWPDKPILKTWPHEVVSNPVKFSISERSNRMRPEDLKWGKPVDGLQAAMEFRLPEGVTGNPLTAPGVPVGTGLGVVFHLKNVSDKPIAFISETGRQGDTAHVKNEQGEKVEVRETWFSGWPIDVLWTLQPGDVAQLHVLAPAINQLDQPGRYTVRYTVRFNSRMMKDDDGNVIFPRPGDYDSEIDTGDTPLVLYEKSRKISEHGEIHGRLLDEKGKPVRGALVACGAVINDSRKGGGARTKTDSLGNYRLPVPSPGIYNVWLKEYRNSNMTTAADDGIVVEAGNVSQSELRLTRGRRVAGKVVDQDGVPVKSIEVHCYSSARPQSGAGVKTVRADQDGNFVFVVPPGRVSVYVTKKVEQTDENPFGIGPGADVVVDVSGSEPIEPLTLKLGTRESKFGSNDWLRKSTPGTQILRHRNAADVTGTVVNAEGQPLAGAEVFKVGGPIFKTDERGEFRVESDRGTQFVMHAFSPGYHVWFGTPTAGDELKIVLEKKPSVEIRN